jgi:hypothetical protein
MCKDSLAVIFLTICPLLLAQQPLPAPKTPAGPQAMPGNSSAAVPAKPNTLLDGTPIKLRIGRNVSSADAKIGEHVDFEVLEEVQVMEVVVIAKGANASATVTEAQPKRRMGREGKLEMTLDYVRLVDNEKAALTATSGGKGGSNVGKMTGAIVATAIFTLGGSALFLLMHGKDITIPKGAEITAYINGDMPLDMAKFGVAQAAPSADLCAVCPVISRSSFVKHRVHPTRRGYRNRRRICRQYTLFDHRRAREPSDWDQEKGVHELDQDPQRHRRHGSPECRTGEGTAKAVTATSISDSLTCKAHCSRSLAFGNRGRTKRQVSR